MSYGAQQRLEDEKQGSRIRGSKGSRGTERRKTGIRKEAFLKIDRK